MKKLVLTLSVLAISAYSFAQGISGGVKAGLNLANQKFSGDGFSASPDARASFHVGGYLNVSFTENLGLQPELLYNSVGFKSGDASLNMGYISVPVMVRYSPVAIFNLQAGPQFGFLMSAKTKLDGESEDVKDGYKSLDLGFGLGAGVDLPMGLNFTARYVLGLSNVGEVEDGADLSVKNNVFQISVGYKLFGGE